MKDIQAEKPLAPGWVNFLYQTKRKLREYFLADHAGEEFRKKIDKILKNGDYSKAEIEYKKLLKKFRNDKFIHGQLGATCGMQGKYKEMIKHCQNAIKINFNYPEAHNNLGYALHKSSDYGQAIQSYKTAIKLRPNYIDAYINLSIALREQGDFFNAIESCRKAIKIDSQSPEAYNSLGSAQLEAGFIEEAIYAYKVALSISERSQYHVNLSFALFLSGDYTNGWISYEYRKKPFCGILHKSLQNLREFNANEFQKYDELLIISEQGLGDVLQFVRFLINLKDKGLNYSFCAPKKIHSLLKSSGIDNHPLTPEQAGSVKAKTWISLMSIPKYLEVNPTQPLNTKPYLRSTKELFEKWKTSIHTDNKLLIGFNWKSNRKGRQKENRNIPIELIRPIIDRSNARFISLQRGISTNNELNDWLKKQELFKEQSLIHELADSDDSNDFLEYAAVIKNCDLVITTATTTAHLAAAMGVVTWVLLPRIPDWRWGLESETTFWYPTMRLFRQRQDGSWRDVLKRVDEELANFLA